jgi:hypothetical protein
MASYVCQGLVVTLWLFAVHRAYGRHNCQNTRKKSVRPQIFLYFWMTWCNLTNRQQIFGDWNLHKPQRQNGGKSVWVCCSAVSRRHTGCSSLYTQHSIDVVGDRLHPPLRRRPSCPEPSHRSPTLGISLDGCTTGLISPDLAGTNSIMECVDTKRRPSIQSARKCLDITDNDQPAIRGLTRC